MRTITVCSPIDEETAKKFTDVDWLAAINEYNEKKDILEGGPYEVSNVLEKLVQNDPDRYVNLATKLPDKTNVDYFNAILRGITNSELDLDSVITVCRRCHELPEKPCGRWITQTIVKFAGEKLPKELLEMIQYYLVNDPDPEEELWNPENSDRKVFYGGNIFESGMNSTRGIAALSLARLLFEDEDLIPIFYDTLKKIVNDPIISVRSCVAETLIGVLKHNPDLALEFFRELCDTNDILLSTRQIERFIFYILNDKFPNVSEIIYRMLFSEIRSVVEVGSRIIAYAYLIHGNILEFYYCLNYSEIHRLGIAQVFSESLKVQPPSAVKDVLSILFDDLSEEVRSEASSCFRGLNDENIGSYTDLIENFIHSPAFKGNARHVMYPLDKIENLPEITLNVCEEFFESAGTKASDIRTETSATASRVVNITFKLYSQSKESDLKIRCLDLIDKMLIYDYLRVQDKLFNYER